MKRATIIFGVVSLLVVIDGLYMVFANYHPGDANTFFGNQTWNISDGEVTLISGAFLCVVTVIMWVIAIRRGARSQASHSAPGQPGRPQPGPPGREQPGQSGGRTASRT